MIFTCINARGGRQDASKERANQGRRKMQDRKMTNQIAELEIATGPVENPSFSSPSFFIAHAADFVGSNRAVGLLAVLTFKLFWHVVFITAS